MDDHKSFWDDISFHSYPDSFTYWGDNNYLCFARNNKDSLRDIEEQQPGSEELPHDVKTKDSLEQPPRESSETHSLQQPPEESTGSEGIQEEDTSINSLEQQTKKTSGCQKRQEQGTSRYSFLQQIEKMSGNGEQVANDETRVMSEVQPEDIDFLSNVDEDKVDDNDSEQLQLVMGDAVHVEHLDDVGAKTNMKEVNAAVNVGAKTNINEVNAALNLLINLNIDAGKATLTTTRSQTRPLRKKKTPEKYKDFYRF